MLLLEFGACRKNLRESGRKPAFNGQTALNSLLPVFRAGQQRHPVVVKIANVLVGQVIDGSAEIRFHPGVLFLAKPRQNGLFNSAPHCNVCVPEPGLPERTNTLHANRERRIRCQLRERGNELRTPRQFREMMSENSSGTPARAVILRAKCSHNRCRGRPRAIAVDLPQTPRRRPLHHLARVAQQLHQRADGFGQRQSPQGFRRSLPQHGIVRSRVVLQLFQNRRGRSVPDVVQLIEQLHRLGREVFQHRRIPAFRTHPIGEVSAQRQDRHLCLPKRRFEVLKRLLRIHPAAERLLPCHQEIQRLLHLRIRRRNPGSLQRPQSMTGLELHFHLIRFEPHGPLAARSLQRKNALGVLLNQLTVLHFVHIGQRQSLVAKVHHVLHGGRRDHFRQPGVMICLPRIPADLERAHQRRIAIGLIGRQLIETLVIDLQILRNPLMCFGSWNTRHIVFEHRRQQGNSAQNIGRCRDHASPHCALIFEAIERPGVVVEPLLQKL